MGTKTKPKYRVIKHIGEHIYYREQLTNRIAVADQSCVGQKGKIHPPTMQDDKTHGVLYINFDKINGWNLAKAKLPYSTNMVYVLPVITNCDMELTVSITESEYKWLVGYF